MPTLYSTVNETGNRNRTLERREFRFFDFTHCIVERLYPKSVLHAAWKGGQVDVCVFLTNGK